MSSESAPSAWTPDPGRKVTPPDGYPPEPGCYLRGNDFSPVAVCVILKWPDDEVPESIERLVRVGVESGAALAGTLQTENIGIEKMICNLVANPNIRYLLVCGPESPGHLVGQSLTALTANGVDEKRRIVGSESPTPYLYNIPPEAVRRFREQIQIIDLVDIGDPEVVREGVRGCYQESPTQFRGFELFDPGAFDGEPICAPITWKVREPWWAPRDADEQAALERAHQLIEQIKAKAEAKRAAQKGEQAERPDS